MKVIIDADGCPVTKITADLCKKSGIEVIIVSDTSHIFNIEGVTTKIVDKGADSADFLIANLANEGDICVTQDYGLASMCLSRKARAIRQDGLIYNNENIDFLLMDRYQAKKARMAGKHLSGPKKRTKEDDIKYIENLKRLLNE